jgi:hypothetical protein
LRKRVSIRDGNKRIDELAAAVLKGRLSDEPLPELRGEAAIPARADEKLHVLRRSELVDTEFSYRWEACYAKAQATQRLAWLTFLLSFGAPAWVGFIYVRSVSVRGFQSGEAGGGIGVLLAVFAIAIFISAFLYVIASFFEGILAKRRANWNYLRARIRDDATANAGE